MTKLDQLHDLEHGEIVGFIQGWMNGAPKGHDLKDLEIAVRDQFHAVSDEADFLDAVHEASARMRMHGQRMKAEGEALRRLGEEMRKQQSN